MYRMIPGMMETPIAQKIIVVRVETFTLFWARMVGRELTNPENKQK